MVNYRCGRCRRRVPEDVVEDHARNAHFADPQEIDFELEVRSE